jgi:formamidopyrimidine-DNA glycosylase
MPELPEIEALRLYLLREGLVGLTVVEMDADWPGVEDTVDGMGGLSPLVGRRIEGIERRGKQLIAGLNIGFTERVSTKRSPIKSVLLDQKVLAGVGNIYADEALLMVGITPSRRADKISAARLESLHNTIVGVLENALAFIESHPDDQGRPYVIDAQDDRIQITRKPGAPCPQCETPLKARKFGGRTAYYCPSCQH